MGKKMLGTPAKLTEPGALRSSDSRRPRIPSPLPRLPPLLVPEPCPASGRVLPEEFSSSEPLRYRHDCRVDSGRRGGSDRAEDEASVPRGVFIGFLDAREDGHYAILSAAAD